MKCFYIDAYCCTPIKKTEKLVEYKSGQSMKLNI